MIGLWLFGSLAVLLLLGVPIAMALGVAALICMHLLDVPLAVMGQRIFTSLDVSSIMAIPFFILAGNLMTTGGISRRLAYFINTMVGRVRGGMAYALVLGCAFFAALSGSAPATVIAVGSALYPEVVRLGYPKPRLAGLLAVSGGLGPIIPPSIFMVVYATITNCSVSNLFSAGLVAGAMLTFVALGLCLYYSYKEKWPKAEQRTTVWEMFVAFLRAIPALMLPLIILGGIYSGLLTPTESASVATIYAFVVGIFYYREISPAESLEIILKSAKNSAMILFIIATSSAFSWVFTFSGISKQLVNYILAFNMSATAFCLVVAFVLLVFGTFLEGIAICVLLAPVLWPVAQQLGVNVVTFGMIFSLGTLIGALTPPVAVNIFAASSVTGLKIGEIARGELPFMLGFTIVFIVFTVFPWFSTFFL